MLGYTLGTMEHKTHTRTVDCDGLFYALITKPSTENNKTPITVTLTSSVPLNPEGQKTQEDPLGPASSNGDVLSCIYYIIPNYKKQSQQTSNNRSNTPYFLTTLQEYTENNELKEFGKKLCIMNFKIFKESHPVYVILTSNLDINSSMDIMMFLNAYKKHVSPLFS